MSRAAKGIKANISRIERARQLRNTRESRPFFEFHNRLTAHIKADEELKEKNISAETKWLFDVAFVSGTVTATEIYFRDMLDTIFRTCRPESFLSALGELHEGKYGIDDLVSIYVKRVHPCELILDDLSFQRVDTIDRVFSRIMGKPFWKSAVPIKVRVKDEPTTENEIGAEVVGQYEKLLQLRHELIHNPDSTKRSLTDDEQTWIVGTGALIFACDLKLINFINSNLDPDLTKSRKAESPNG